MIENPEFQLIIYPTKDDKHAIGFVMPATESEPAKVRGLLKFANLELLDNHADKIKEYVKYLREGGGIPKDILNAYKLEEE